MGILTADAVSVRLGTKDILKQVNATLPAGKITAIIGPNGSGKSTLLKAFSKNLPLAQGAIYFKGRDIARLSHSELARSMAILPQSPQSPPDITVRDLVEHGRFPHRRWWQGGSAEDRSVVEQSLSETGMTAFADRLLSTLSGGERQRAWIAMALAQRPEVLLLDEPTTYLDICHQIEVLELVAGLNRNNAMTVVMVLHDINQAIRYADFAVVLRAGQIVNTGPAAATVTAGVLRDVFQVEAEVLQDAGRRNLFVMQGVSKQKEAGESKVDTTR